VNLGGEGMKRTMVALLCIALAAGSLAGCGGNKDKKEVPVNTEAKAEDKPEVGSKGDPQKEEDTEEEQKEEEKDNTEVSGENENSQDAGRERGRHVSGPDYDHSEKQCRNH